MLAPEALVVRRLSKSTDLIWIGFDLIPLNKNFSGITFFSKLRCYNKRLMTAHTDDVTATLSTDYSPLTSDLKKVTRERQQENMKS